MNILQILGMIITALFTASVTALLLPITMNWRLREKRRERSLSLESEANNAYAEWCYAWKMWNYTFDPNPAVIREVERRHLLRLATKAEYKMETVLHTLTTGRVLPADLLEKLAKFRQSSQALRGAIRRNERLNWESPTDPQLVAFRSGFSVLTNLLGTLELVQRPDPLTSANTYLEIADPKWESKWAEPVQVSSKNLPWYTKFGIQARE